MTLSADYLFLIEVSNALFDLPRLESHGKAFRICRLAKESGHEPIACEVFTSRITTARYDTSSYVWGPFELDYSTSCNDKKMVARPSLRRAIDYLRLPNEDCGIGGTESA